MTNLARIVFACGLTALVVIAVYYGILWLERTDTPARAAGYGAVSLTEPDCARGVLIKTLSKTGRILLSLSALSGHFCRPLLRLRL